MGIVDKNSFTLASACYGDTPVAELVSVMDALKNVIEIENELLSLGLPPVGDLGEHKDILAEEYAQLLGNIGGEDGIEISDPALQQQLRASNDELSALSKTNSALLDMAVSATRRRVDAVMEAIRACEMGADDLAPETGTELARHKGKNGKFEA